MRRLALLLTFIVGLVLPAQAHNWVEGLPGPTYPWTGLGAYLANILRDREGYACGKIVWLPKPDTDVLLPGKILWSTALIDEPIPDDVLPEGAIVSLALTQECAGVETVAWADPRGPASLLHLASSPAILTKASSSPWTVDATFNVTNNTIYATGPGGQGAPGIDGTAQGGAAGGGGATVFVANYNNSWTPGSSTATFQVTAQSTNTSACNSSFNTTFDSSAFVACAAAKANGTSAGGGGTSASSTVPTGGTKHSGGAGGTGGTSGTSNSGAGGGGAGGTTANGGIGGAVTNGTGHGGGGGAGADGGATGQAGQASNHGGNGTASGVGGSTGGSGCFGSNATSGTVGGGGGGACSIAGAGATPGNGGGSTEFDGTHGAGGGGGGGGAVGFGNPAGSGGTGGNYGGGGGGGGNSGSGTPGSGGTGGDGLVFITWTAITTFDSKSFLHQPLTHW